jgi:hypothetical protein
MPGRMGGLVCEPLHANVFSQLSASFKPGLSQTLSTPNRSRNLSCPFGGPEAGRW